MSELHRQRILTGFAVVRRIDGENVFLPSGQLCRVVHPGAVDFHGMDAAQGTDQPFLVELTVIHFHEVHHTLQDCGTEGIGFALPCVHNQPQSLAVDFLAHLVVQLECSAYAADAVVAQLQAVIVEVQTHPVGGCEECHGKSILAHDLGTELDARRQRCSVTVLLCEEQGFLLHRQTRIHLAENREVFATVAQDNRSCRRPKTASDRSCFIANQRVIRWGIVLGLQITALPIWQCDENMNKVLSYSPSAP